MATPSRAPTPAPAVVSKAKPAPVPPPKANAGGKPVARGDAVVSTSAKSTPVKSPELKRLRRVTEVCDVHGVVKNLSADFDATMNEMPEPSSPEPMEKTVTFLNSSSCSRL